MKIVGFIFISLALAACAQSTPASPRLAPLLQEQVAFAREGIGEDFFGLFALRDARSDGDTLVFEWTVNADLQADYTQDPENFEAEFSEVLLPDICLEPDYAQIIRMGGAIRHEFYSEAGVGLTSITATTCGD